MSEETGEKTAETLTPEDTRVALAAGNAVAFDIRELSDWQADRIPGSIHVSVEDLADRVAEENCEKAILVCADGERSAEVAWQLQGRGVEASSIEGGFKAWLDSGLPLQPSGDPAEIPNPDPDEELENREDSAVDPKVF